MAGRREVMGGTSPISGRKRPAARSVSSAGPEAAASPCGEVRASVPPMGGGPGEDRHLTRVGPHTLQAAGGGGFIPHRLPRGERIVFDLAFLGGENGPN